MTPCSKLLIGQSADARRACTRAHAMRACTHVASCTQRAVRGQQTDGRGMATSTLVLLLLGAAAAEEGNDGGGPCPELLYGIGLHGTGLMKKAPHAASVEECCMSALTALGGTWHCDGFTYDNATGSCLLFRAPLRPHAAGAENNTSGSWISVGPLPPSPPPPGPPVPAVPFPAARPTIPTTPTFTKPPRPNIVLFFGDGAPSYCCLLAAT